MLNCLAVGMGGFIGAVMRYLIGLVPVKETLKFPMKTFAINIIGAFLIGMIAAWVLKNKNFDPKLALFLKVGICGGFTTFSSFALESADLFKTGLSITGILYILLSVSFGIFAVFAGEYMIR